MVLKPYHPSVVTDLNILASFKVDRLRKPSTTVEEYVNNEFKQAIESFVDIVMKTDAISMFNELVTKRGVHLFEGSTVEDVQARMLKDTRDSIRDYLVTELKEYNHTGIHEMVEYLRDVIETDCNICMEIYMSFENNSFSFSIIGVDC